MRQKELRIALVCYGGVSLAVIILAVLLPELTLFLPKLLMAKFFK